MGSVTEIVSWENIREIILLTLAKQNLSDLYQLTYIFKLKLGQKSVD